MIKRASSLAELLHVFKNLMFDLRRQDLELLGVDVDGIGIFINLVLKRQRTCYCSGTNHREFNTDTDIYHRASLLKLT